MKFNELDPVLSTPVRLAVVSVLIRMREADFNYLLAVTGTTQGNLSHQLKKLKEAGYIEITKTFKGNYPQTVCKLSKPGHAAFEKYVKDIKNYLHL